ncbi:MAG TPA: hypothetical protein VFC51_15320 [Chloroflexota bacterium]|nr:hypothetical protein [Chloroflexota bacterium]
MGVSISADVANLLSGATDVALDTITFAQMLQLQQEWGSSHQGTARFTVASFTAAHTQLRPDYANPT